MNFTGANRQLGDPTWYRVRYAIAIRCMQIATGNDDPRVGKSGWPKGMAKKGKTAWEQWFGPETRDLLINLFDDQEAIVLPEKPAVAAMEGAKELLVTTTAVLNDARWHWVGRRPPRYLLWSRQLTAWAKRRLLRWRDEGTIAGDKELTAFLSGIVEPATVILFCSTRLLNDEDWYLRLKDAILGRTGTELRPVDRRDLETADVDRWSLGYLSTFLVDQQVGDGRSARVEARLGRTKYRTPRPPAPRVRYSLACLLSRLATKADRAREETVRDFFLSSAAAQLEGALSDAPSTRRDPLAKWSRVDPDLAGLRSHQKKVFEAIVARWGPSERRQIVRRKLDSTVVASAAYVADGKLLELELGDGSRYQYFDVPEDVYDKLIGDSSPDRVFGEEIAPHFASIRLSGE